MSPLSIVSSSLNDSILAEIAFDDFHAGNALHRQDIQGYHPTAIAQALPHHLRPAAGRRAEINHDHAGLEQAIAFKQFFQFEYRPRTPALALCTLDERIARNAP